jgi:hypothetical protein
MGKDGKDDKNGKDKGEKHDDHEDPDSIEYGYRELALGDLDGSTLDACMSAEARLRLMQKDRERNSDAWPELVVSVLLHLAGQLYQYVILVLFCSAKVERMYHPYQPHMLYHNAHSLRAAIAMNNATLASPHAYSMCSMNQSFPWIHRLMMGIWFSKMNIEMANCLWRMYKMWVSLPVANHDAAPVSQRTLIAEYTYKEHVKKPLSKLLDSKKKTFIKNQTKKTPWWEKEKIEKAWSTRLLIVDANGHGQKEKALDSGDEEYLQEVFPVRVILGEQEEVHEIGEFSVVWMMFVSIFAVIPNFLMILYVWYKGAQLIAVTGSLGKLVKVALKMKFLLKVPETLFEGYACQNLKDYIEATTYRIKVAQDETDIWNKWLSTATKLTLAGLGGVLGYTLGFHHVYDFRKLCSVYGEQFPATECLTLECTGLSAF